MKKIFGVLGGGSWGTAIIKILSYNMPLINWYVRNEQNAIYIKNYNKNPNYLRSINLNKNNINVSSSIEEVVKNSDIIILAIPSPFLDQELKKIQSI